MTINRQRPFKVDIDSFNQLFGEHYPALRAYAGFLVGDNMAEDIVQDVFLNTWESRDTIAIHTSAKAYLFKSVYHRCLNNLRRVQLAYGNQPMESWVTTQEILLSDPDKNHIIQTLYVREMRSQIDEAIGNLPPKCREVFLLSYINALKNKEISRLLGISVSTVEKHINHALKTLRKALQHIKMLLINFLFFLSTLS